jgi:hypothetical protein
MGQPELATVEKGRLIYEEGVKQLSGMIEFFHGRPKDVRTPHQANQTTMPIPWNQREIPPTGD